MKTSVKYLMIGALTGLAVLSTSTLVADGTASAQDVRSVGPIVQYHNPKGMPRWTNSYAVSYEPWLEAVSLDRVYPSDQSDNLLSQLRSAFARLDQILAKKGLSSLDILKVNVMYKGDSFENTLDVSSAMGEYFRQRLNRAPRDQSFIDYPIGSVLGIKGFRDRDVLVALDVTLTNAHQFSAAEFMVPGNRLGKIRSAGSSRNVMIGGVTAMQDNFMVKGFGDIKSEARAVMDNFLRVVKAAGGNARNISSLTVYYRSTGGKAGGARKGARVVSARGRDLIMPAADMNRQKILSSAIGNYFRSAGVPQPEAIDFVPVVVACGIKELGILVEGTARVSS